jgi:hypothetical protein
MLYKKLCESVSGKCGCLHVFNMGEVGGGVESLEYHTDLGKKGEM